MKPARALSLDEFASITARLEASASRERVLDEAGLEEEEWVRVQETWLERMERLTARGNPALHRRFLERLAVHVAAEASKQPPLQGPSPKAPAPAVAPLLGAAARAAGRVRQAPASPLGPGMQPMPAAMRMASGLPSMQAAAPSPAPAPPAAVAAPARAPAPATAMMQAIPLQAAALPFRGGPASAEPRAAPRRDALPFAPRGQAQPAPRPANRAGAMPAAQDPLTQTMSGDEPPSPKGALPFAKSAPPDDLTGTLEQASPFAPPNPAPSAALPFARNPSVPPAAAAAPRLDALPFRSASQPPPIMDTVDSDPDVPGSGGALPFRTPAPGASSSARRPQAGGGAGLPFRAPTPARPAAPVLSIEQYAWLCAMLERAPEHAVQTLAQLRLDPGAKAHLDAQFKIELERDPRKREAFEQARRGYLGGRS